MKPVASHFWVWLKDRHGEAYIHHDDFLPGLVPDHVIDLMTPEKAKEMEICDKCESKGFRSYVMQPVSRHSFRHLCPVLFSDAFPVPWRPDDVL